MIAAATKLLTEGSAPFPSVQAATEKELQSAVGYEKAINEAALA